MYAKISNATFLYQINLFKNVYVGKSYFFVGKYNIIYVKQHTFSCDFLNRHQSFKLRDKAMIVFTKQYLPLRLFDSAAKALSASTLFIGFCCKIPSGRLALMDTLFSITCTGFSNLGHKTKHLIYILNKQAQQIYAL